MIKSFKDLAKLPRSMWVLGIATLVNRLGTMALPYLALYLTRDRGFPVTTAGTIIALYGIVALFVGPIAGTWADKFGAAKVMEISLFLTGVVLILFPLAHSLFAIIAMAMLWSLISEAYRPASMSLTGQLVPAAQRKSAYAFMRLSVNLGMSVGPFAGGLLAKISYPAIFVVDGATTLLACLLLVLMKFKAHAKKSSEAVKEAAAPDSHNLKPLANSDFVFFLLATIPVIVVFFQHISTMPVFLVRDLRFPESSYGLLFAINTALIISFEVPITAAISHWNYRKSLSTGALLFALGFGSMAFTKTFLAVALTVAVWTLGEMILFPAMNAYVSDLAPARLRGQYMGSYVACFSGGFVVAPWLGTQILDRYGGYTLWVSMLFFGLLSPLMLAMVALPKNVPK